MRSKSRWLQLASCKQGRPRARNKHGGCQLQGVTGSQRRTGVAGLVLLWTDQEWVGAEWRGGEGEWKSGLEESCLVSLGGVKVQGPKNPSDPRGYLLTWA